FRKLYPDGKLIAHQANGLPLFWLSYHISASEVPDAPLPDFIITNGRHGVRFLTHSGHPSARIICGGGLRQQYLDRLRDTPIERPNKTKRILLVTPSIGLDESLELITKVIKAFGDEPHYDVIIKCHPSMPFARIQSSLSSPLPKHMMVSDQ